MAILFYGNRPTLGNRESAPVRHLGQRETTRTTHNIMAKQNVQLLYDTTSKVDPSIVKQ